MHRVSECREGHHGMIAARVYSYYRSHIYQARGAGAGADADQAGELQLAPTPLKTRRLESGPCPWDPGLKLFWWADGWAGGRDRRLAATLISGRLANRSKPSWRDKKVRGGIGSLVFREKNNVELDGEHRLRERGEPSGREKSEVELASSLFGSLLFHEAEYQSPRSSGDGAS
jgi:hypothetical protein